MRILEKRNVYEAALDRIRYLFDEFEEVSVGVSGGKDSTVIFNLAMQVAKEKDRLPLSVIFIDQEAEWTYTIDQIKKIMYHPDVKPLWFQFEWRLDNATSWDVEHLDCWKEGDTWVREKDEISIKENTYGHKDWDGIFTAIFRKEFAGKRHCNLSGVRTEESPIRFVGLTTFATYKWITWGNKEAGDNHYTFYPIYDWSYTDVWKAIYDNKWEYNKIYDYMYKYGIKIPNMRVSNLHHETAVTSLFYLQEIDPQLYAELSRRLQGVDTAGKMGFDDYFAKNLPFMFKDWEEYRDHLIKKLVKNRQLKAKIKRFIKFHNNVFKKDRHWRDKAAKCVIQTILANDIAGTKMRNFRLMSERYKEDLKKINVSKTTSK